MFAKFYEIINFVVLQKEITKKSDRNFEDSYVYKKRNSEISTGLKKNVNEMF